MNWARFILAAVVGYVVLVAAGGLWHVEWFKGLYGFWQPRYFHGGCRRERRSTNYVRERRTHLDVRRRERILHDCGSDPARDTGQQ